MGAAMIAFDTLKFANRLKAAGVLGESAEAQALALAEALHTQARQAVTPTDLHAALRELELRMTIKQGAMPAVAVGPLTALIKFV